MSQFFRPFFGYFVKRDCKLGCSVPAVGPGRVADAGQFAVFFRVSRETRPVLVKQTQ